MGTKDIKTYANITFDKANDKFFLYDDNGVIMGYITYANLLTALQAESPLDDDAIHESIDGEINGLSAKGTPVDADVLLGEDSASSFGKVKIALSTLVRTAGTQTIAGSKTFSNSATFSANVDILGQAAIDELLLGASKTLSNGTYNSETLNDFSFINLDTSTADIIINGFADGEVGQIVAFNKTAIANKVILTHNNGSGTQKLITPNSQTVEMDEYGTFIAICTGSLWRLCFPNVSLPKRYTNTTRTTLRQEILNDFPNDGYYPMTGHLVTSGGPPTQYAIEAFQVSGTTVNLFYFLNGTTSVTWAAGSISIGTTGTWFDVDLYAWKNY